jgi:hypothetical protein
VNDETALLKKLRCARLRFRDNENDDDGVTLTRKELSTLLKMLPRPRKRDHMTAIRHRTIATLCALYEAEEPLVKNAVSRIEERYKVSDSLIFQVRDEYPMSFKGADPEKLRELIGIFERQLTAVLEGDPTHFDSRHFV